MGKSKQSFYRVRNKDVLIIIIRSNWSIWSHKNECFEEQIRKPPGSFNINELQKITLGTAYILRFVATK